jgi:hypothetical protein
MSDVWHVSILIRNATEIFFRKLVLQNDRVQRTVVIRPRINLIIQYHSIGDNVIKKFNTMLSSFRNGIEVHRTQEPSLSFWG